LQELCHKFKLIQYRGVKNYPWTKFGNALEKIYKEMDMLGHKVDPETQVQHLMEACYAPSHKASLADLVFTHPDAKQSLSSFWVWQ